MKFVQFTEANDNEGEEWNFWLQLDGNEKQLKELESWLGTFDDDGEQYNLYMGTVIEENEVDVLVKHGGQGYMDYHNKVTGTFACPDFDGEETSKPGYEQLDNELYKGAIINHFENRKS